MATLKLRTGSERLKAAESKHKAVRDWSDGKVSAIQRDKVLSKANDKLRGA